jgi:hypothetical protein
MGFLFCRRQARNRYQLPKFLSRERSSHTLRAIGVDNGRSRQDSAAKMSQEEAKGVAE